MSTKKPYESKHVRGKYLTGRPNHMAFIPEWRLIKFSDGTAYTIRNKQLAELASRPNLVHMKVRITPTVTMEKVDRFFKFTKTVRGKVEEVVLDIKNASIRELFEDTGDDDEDDEFSYNPTELLLDYGTPAPLTEQQARDMVAGEDVYDTETILDEWEK